MLYFANPVLSYLHALDDILQKRKKPIYLTNSSTSVTVRTSNVETSVVKDKAEISESLACFSCSEPNGKFNSHNKFYFSLLFFPQYIFIPNFLFAMLPSNCFVPSAWFLLCHPQVPWIDVLPVLRAFIGIASLIQILLYLQLMQLDV